MQREVRQPFSPCLRVALEEWQDSTLTPLLQPPHPGPPHGDRPTGQAYPPGLAVAMAVKSPGSCHLAEAADAALRRDGP